jgi:hypothetical protein
MDDLTKTFKDLERLSNTDPKIAKALKRGIDSGVASLLDDILRSIPRGGLDTAPRERVLSIVIEIQERLGVSKPCLEKRIRRRIGL